MRRLLPALAAAALLLAGCGGEADLPANLGGADAHTSAHASPTTAAPVADVPLRTGERFQELRLPTTYTPKSPTPNGTDDYRCFLVDPGFRTDQLVSGVQITPDNAAMESFNATYKRECVGLAQAGGGYATRAEAADDFFNYVEKYYNRVRRHSALGYQSPVDFELQLN